MTQSETYGKFSKSNVWKTQIVQILREKRDGDFIFKIKFLSGIKKPIGLSHKWIKKKFKYKDPEIYSRLFDDS